MNLSSLIYLLFQATRLIHRIFINIAQVHDIDSDENKPSGYKNAQPAIPENRPNSSQMDNENLRIKLDQSATLPNQPKTAQPLKKGKCRKKKLRGQKRPTGKLQ